MQRNTWPPMADPHHQAHWFVMALLALLIVLAAGGASLSGRGWQAATITSGAGAVTVAGASLVMPESASALHPAWAVTAALWGLGILGVTWQASRDGRS